MSCEICGRSSCSRSFHSLAAQESFDSQPKDLNAANERIAELEANIKTLRKSGISLIGILEEILYAVSIDKSCNARVRAIAATLEQ